MIRTSYQSPCSRKARDAPAGFVEIRIGLRITESDVARSVASGKKCFTGNSGHAGGLEDMHGAVLAVLARQPRRIGQHIIGALWDRGRQTCLSQGCAEAIAFMLVLLRQLAIE